MSYLIGNGWWVIRYIVLWVGVSPVVVMTAALPRGLPNDPMPGTETALAIRASVIRVHAAT